MRRREFISSLGAAVAWPLAARAQPAGKPPTIGYLGGGTLTSQRAWRDAFVQRLSELGWIEGRTVAIVYRWGEGRPDRYAEFAAEFVRLKVDVILAGGTEAAVAAQQATSVIPIVFPTAGDPIGSRLVASLARPGGNVTGLSNLATISLPNASKFCARLCQDCVGWRRWSTPTIRAARWKWARFRRRRARSASRSSRCPSGAQRISRPPSRGSRAARRRFIRPATPRIRTEAAYQYICAGCAPADDVSAFGIRRSGRSDVLWCKLPGPEPARRRLCRQDPARRQAGRPPGRAADQVRSGHQPGHREGAWPTVPPAAGARRRGDRVERSPFA